MTRGALTFVFDDGYQAVFDYVLPLLRQHGLRAVFAVPVEPRDVRLPKSVNLQTSEVCGVDGETVAPLSAWKAACERYGHELAAHGVTHRSMTVLSDAELESELKSAQEATGATILVYPGGAHDERVVAAAQRHFRAARTVRPGTNPVPAHFGNVRAAHSRNVPSHDRFRLRSFVTTKQNFRVWKWNLRALWAWLTNRWLIETYHNVSLPAAVPVFASGAKQSPGRIRDEIASSARPAGGLLAKTATPLDRHTIPLAALEKHLRFVKRLPLRIATIQEMLQNP